jgi:hypothetical protein
MFKNLRELIVAMPDEATCKSYLVQQRWNGKPECPFCGCGSYYLIDKGNRYKCSNNVCNMKYSVTTGTIFHASKVPLVKWLTAVYLCSAHKKGISSYQLSRDIGVTQRTAWFMIHRIREAFKEKENVKLDTVVEVDTTFTGGKMKNKHYDVRMAAHFNNVSHVDGKTEVIGYLQRGSDIKLMPLDRSKTFKGNVKDNVKPEAVVLTDGYIGFKDLVKEFDGHAIVNHKADEYVRGFVHTNSIEGAFSHFKRMVFGTYHQITPKHLERYCDEFAYRFNTRKIKDNERFELVLKRINCRLPYKTLVYGESIQQIKENSKKGKQKSI